MSEEQESQQGTVKPNFGKLPFTEDQLATFSVMPADQTIGESRHRIPAVNDDNTMNSLPTRATMLTINQTQTAIDGLDPHPDALRTPLPHNGPDFVLQEVIGRGGQGEVWSAMQASLQREIAVKIHKTGRIADFLIEAYTSGELDHPNIVPIYELARISVNGKECPLLAMKLVRGKSWLELTDHDRRKEDYSLEVFLARHIAILVSVCHAVSYAHSKRIIHRDLKLHQVIIGEFGEVYLVDWGLAISLEKKATKVSESGVPKFRTLDLTWGVSGTPAYMAPEQTSDSPDGLGIHTDVYLLGATLYHLISGKPPHNAHTAEAALFKAMMNEIAPLPDHIPAELDALIMRSMATEPSERHASVEDFRKDLEDYLSGAGRQRESRRILGEVRQELEHTEDVFDYTQFIALDQAVNRSLQLWPDNHEAEEVHQTILYQHALLALKLKDLRLALSLGCQLDSMDRQRTVFTSIDKEQELIRRETRQRKTFLVSSVSLIVLIPIVLLITWYRESDLQLKSREDKLERMAEEGRRELYMERASLMSEAWAVVQEEAELAESFTRHLPIPQSIRGEANGEMEENADVIAGLLERRASLKARRERLSSDLNMQAPPPELLIGEANYHLAKAASTADFLQAHDMYKAVADQKPFLPAPRTGMGISAARAGFFTSGTLNLLEAVDLTRTARGERHQETARALALAAESYLLLDEEGEAHRELYQQSIDILEPQWGELSLRLADYWRRLGEVQAPLDYSSPTLPLYTRRYGVDSEEMAEAYRVVAKSLRLQGEFRESHELVQKAYDIVVRVRGRFDGHTADLMRDLADSLVQLGRHSEAETHLREALIIYRETLGADHAKVGETYRAIAALYNQRGDIATAIEFERKALEITQQAYGERHPATATAYTSYALALSRTGNRAEAHEFFRKALHIHRTVLGEEHPDTARGYDSMAMEVHAAAGQFEEAEILLRRALTILEARFGGEHFSAAPVQSNLARVLAAQGRREESTAWHLTALRTRQRVFGDRHPALADSLIGLADNQMTQGHPERAFLLYRRAEEIFEDRAHGARWDAENGMLKALEAQDQTQGVARARDRFALALTLEKAFLQRGTVTVGQVGSLYASYLAAMARVLPDFPWARSWHYKSLAMRAAAAARIAGIPTSDPLWTGFINPLAERYGFAADLAALRDPSAALTTEDGVIDGRDLLAHMQSTAAMPQWPREVTSITEIAPRGQALAEALAGALAALGNGDSQRLVQRSDWERALDDGKAWFLLREYGRAARSFRDAASEAGGSNQMTELERARFRAEAWFQTARSFAALGEIEQGFAFLEESLRAGFEDRDRLRNDTFLSPLRADDIRFDTLVQR